MEEGTGGREDEETQEMLVNNVGEEQLSPGESRLWL